MVGVILALAIPIVTTTAAAAPGPAASVPLATFFARPTPTPAPVGTPTPTPTSTSGLVITAVGASSITQTAATITWTVSAPATGQVQYGTTTAYGSLSALENSYVYTTHVQQLSGLAAGTLYHYRARSTDAAGRSAVSADYTFTTLTATPTATPSPTPTPTRTPTPTPTPSPTPTPTSAGGPFPAPVTTQTVNVPTTIDATGASDAGSALQSFLASVRDGSVIAFKAGGVYRLDRGILVQNRHNLVFEGNGATLRTGGTLYLTSMWADPFVIYGSATSVTDIVIRDFTLEGPGDQSVEGPHGVGVYGGSRIEITNSTIRKMGGDGVYAANGSTTDWVNGLWVHDNTLTSIGRNAFTMNAVQNALLERNAIDQVGGSVLDIEPDLSTQGAINVTLRNNTVGVWGLSPAFTMHFVACANNTSGIGAVIRGLTITGNTVTAGAPNSVNTPNAGGLSSVIAKSRTSNVTFANNTTTKAGTGPALIFEHVDGLTVTGNVQPLTSGSLTYITDSTGVVSQ